MNWTFRGEARWMVWLYALPPLLGIVLALLIPMLRR
jgi:hypothetical protein